MGTSWQSVIACYKRNTSSRSARYMFKAVREGERADIWREKETQGRIRLVEFPRPVSLCDWGPFYA